MLTIGLLLPATSPAGAASETPVVTSPPDQFRPAAGDGYAAWTTNSHSKPKHYDTYAMTLPAGAAFKVNPAGTFGWSGGIDGNVMIGQEVKNNKSDAHMIDLATMDRNDPPGKVNSRFWDWDPDFSGDLYALSRNNCNMAKREWQRIILVDAGASTSKTLAQVKSCHPWLRYAQVEGQYVTWTKCSDTCDVFLYDSASNTTTKLQDGGLQQWSSSVTEDGTLYYIRGDGTCHNIQLVRDPLVGSDTVIATVQGGYAALELTANTNPDTSVDVYYDRFRCKSYPIGNGDIYMIEGADTAASSALPLTLNPMGEAERIPSWMHPNPTEAAAHSGA